MKENIEVTRFSNGLTILTEKMPDVRSATLGFFYSIGSRHEPIHLSGISHFIEHTVFKGTDKRTALEIAIETDRLGGHFDAFTMHEQTGFTMKTVDSALPNAFDLMADMLTNPKFDEVELKREQKVIIEEIKMVEDSPEELLGELFQAEFYPNHPLGLSIAGTPKTVRTFNHEVTKTYHAENFTPQNLIIAVAGNIDHTQVVELAEQFFNIKTKDQRPKTKDQRPTANPIILLKKKRELEQTHLLLATDWVDAKSPKRYAAHLLENILGTGTSSRLWQKIREENGLAYSVGTSGMSFEDCGIFTIYAGTSPKQLSKTIDLTIKELRKIKRQGVTENELELAKQQTIAGVLLGLEDSGVRASNLAQSEMTHGRQISLEETLQNVENVTVEDLQVIADEFFQTEKLALAAIGNLNGLKIGRERLEI
ncbi:MAG: insulinase family protein [Pyrinomonadaceae bacterium]|nr:insulinase family protein [Pyrinomonadaceae bacterium]